MKLFDLLTGRSLIYRQQNETLLPDEISFHILPKNDANRRTNRLRVRLPVIMISQDDPLIKIEKFPDRIKLITGNNYSLSPEIFQVTHPVIKPAGLEYRLVQAGSNGVKFLIKNDITELFTQDDINKGKTYILLNRTHFGAKSNGNRSKIIYQITKSPENGTLYWVAGETEANTFTQDDIDEERVLYAQLNMQAFQDQFEFKVENELNETIQSISYVRVLPILNPQTLIANGSSIALITDKHLNASILQGLTPRFFVIISPRFGRFILNENIDQFVEYFTYNDVINNGLSYQSNQTDVMIFDFAELELNADQIQPARFRFEIEIHPSIQINYIPSTDSTTNYSISLDDLSHSSMVPKNGLLNYYYVLIILFALIIIVITTIIIFRRHSKHQRQLRVVNAQKRRELVAKTKADLEKQPDLLSTTVYATIGRNRRELPEKRSDRSLQTFDGSKHHTSLIQTPISQRTQSKPFIGESIDYRGLNIRNTPELNKSRPDRYQSTRLKDNQYWV
ncbi:hypothetical protein LOAG_18440 [Loa loa]|uniref:Chondroitin sulfate proteoglycan 4 n=1 Tax=Loa loa TaxID=7209 RepID=A0A1S0UHD6_LOALO|nr:hypothetical protein LOAG_18440 [Loa loa]EJD74214.1 hypothetical protein LOAG_18440 [Loa loa]